MASHLRKWFFRCLILLAIPVLLALGDGVIRPVGSYTPTSVKKNQEQPSEVSGNKEEAEVAASQQREEELKFVRGHFEGVTAMFLDARLEADYIEGHIPGAYHLPFEAFFSGRPPILDFMPEDELYIIYCEGGNCDSSHKVGEMLSDYGYTKVKIFQSGYPAWLDQGWEAEVGAMEVEF
jgi:rhodanese-related sulfurtransferase